jgi:hypothetical protein
MPATLISKHQSAQAATPLTPSESVLRYTALALALLLIYSALALHADATLHASNADMMHGSLSGFLPFPSSSLPVHGRSGISHEHTHPNADSSAPIAPGMVPTPAPADLSVVSPSDTDSATYAPQRMNDSGRRQSQQDTSNDANPVSIHTPPLSFEGD